MQTYSCANSEQTSLPGSWRSSRSGNRHLLWPSCWLSVTRSTPVDDSRLDTLLLTMPISLRGTLQEYVGRLHRIQHGKKVVRVFDFVDAQVPMLGRMYEKRLKGYSDIGYEIDSGGEMQGENVDARRLPGISAVEGVSCTGD